MLGSSSSFAEEDVDYSSSVKGKALAVPHRSRPADAVDLIVRPDTLIVELAIRDVRPTSTEALAAISKTSKEVLGQIIQATGGAATLTERGISAAKVFRTEHNESGVRQRRFVGVEVTMDGLVELPMGRDLDFWARSRLFVTMLELIARISEQAESKEEPLRSVRFENLKPTVKDPEAYRSILTERWVTRARNFAALAQAKQAPLNLLDCVPPSAITQTEPSLEEVTLQLAIKCRIDVSDRPPPSTR